MLAKEHIDDLLNRNGNVVSTDGDKIGSIGQVYSDDTDGQPSWVTVETGLFGTSESFVPLEGARLEGDDIVVPFTKDQVKDAPRVDVDGHLEPSEENRLYDHYRLGGGGRTHADTADDRADRTDRLDGTNDVNTVGRDTSGRTTDDAMTRSEERLNVGTERQEKAGPGSGSTSPRRTSPRPSRCVEKKCGLSASPSRTPTVGLPWPDRTSATRSMR